MASGEWIYFLNAGDTFYSSSTVSSIFDRISLDFDVIYGDVYKKKADGLKLEISDRPFFSSKHKFLSMGFHHQSVFVKTDLAKKKKFNLAYKCCADYCMIHTIYKAGGRFFYINIPISIVEARYGYSDKNRGIQMREEARILGIEKSMRFIIYEKYVAMKSKLKTILKNMKNRLN